MKRDINDLVNNKFDLLIIGGGIHGAALSWQAALAGLSVALIEKEDFGHATSANSQKIIHGGIRYLQSFDFGRIRQSLRERRRLMHLAPHLVHPLPCLMPVYGHGLRGLEAMSLGLKLYDLIGRDRNKDSDPSKFIPNGKILASSEICQIIPGINRTGLKGAAKWYDSYCYNSERLVLAFIKSANQMGCVVANYVKATNFLPKTDSGIIIKAHDKIDDQHFDVFSKNVVNCSGPWIYDLLDSSSNEPERKKIKYALGVNVITKKLVPHEMAVGLRNQSNRKSGLYFVTPWRGKSIIGTEWFVNDNHPDELMADENQCLKLIEGLNAAYKPANLSLDDVDHVHVGLVPSKNRVLDKNKEVNLLNQHRIIDHHKEGLGRIASIVGVKYTTAGDVSKKVLRYMFPGVKISKAIAQRKLIGGDIDNFSDFKTEMTNKWESKLNKKNEITQLLFNYGSEAEKIIKTGKGGPQKNSSDKDPLYDILKGETLFAVKEEMAQKLSDVVLRRTQLGTAGYPLESDLVKASFFMAKKLGWSEARRISEIEDTRNHYPPFILLKNPGL
jgi:glycerol-3-phosphate dehydrogenase